MTKPARYVHGRWGHLAGPDKITEVRSVYDRRAGKLTFIQVQRSNGRWAKAAPRQAARLNRIFEEANFLGNLRFSRLCSSNRLPAWAG